MITVKSGLPVVLILLRHATVFGWYGSYLKYVDLWPKGVSVRVNVVNHIDCSDRIYSLDPNAIRSYL